VLSIICNYSILPIIRMQIILFAVKQCAFLRVCLVIYLLERKDF
jgi:hypothetical protein